MHRLEQMWCVLPYAPFRPQSAESVVSLCAVATVWAVKPVGLCRSIPAKHMNPCSVHPCRAGKRRLGMTWEIGAKDGARSRDNQIHNLGLYQLSYFRHQVGP